MEPVVFLKHQFSPSLSCLAWEKNPELKTAVLPKAYAVPDMVKTVRKFRGQWWWKAVTDSESWQCQALERLRYIYFYYLPLSSLMFSRIQLLSFLAIHEVDNIMISPLLRKEAGTGGRENLKSCSCNRTRQGCLNNLAKSQGPSSVRHFSGNNPGYGH